MSQKKINVCITCGSDNITINNCGYSSFNVGSGECKQCGNTTTSNNGSWDNSDWIIEGWNYSNPTKKQEIEQLEFKIKKFQEQIEKAKQRKW